MGSIKTLNKYFMNSWKELLRVVLNKLVAYLIRGS